MAIAAATTRRISHGLRPGHKWLSEFARDMAGHAGYLAPVQQA